MFSRITSRLYLNTGHTFIELMVVLVISGVLVVLATMDFTEQSSHQRLRHTSHRIVSQLRLIRQKAITEGKTLTIQFIPDSGQYDLPGHGGQTLPGKILFGASDQIHKIPRNRDGTPPEDGVSFNQNKVTFQPNGTYAGLGGSIYLMNDSPRRETIAITVNLTGRVKLYRWNGHVWE